jgi:two-component system CheB/CheR fusion protein
MPWCCVHDRSVPLSRAPRYLIAVAATLAALLARLWLSRYLEPPYILFYPTVMIVAMVLGVGPGLVATALAGICAALWILPAEADPPHAAQDTLGLALFSMMGVFMAVVAHLYRRARERLVANEKIRAIMAERDARVRASEERLRAITEAIPDPVFLKDRASRMLLANPATLQAIGKAAEEILGKSDREFYEDPEVGATIAATDARIMDSGVPDVVEERIQTPAGYRVFLSTKAPFRDQDGRVVGLIGVARDITERKQAEDALREADRRKSEFLSVLSHELRNPLAPIRNALYLLDRAPAGGEQAQRAREVLGRQVTHLTRLVDDLLDVTRISRGKVTLHRTRFDARDLVQRTVEDHRQLLAARELRVVLDLAPGPMVVDADATRVSQIVGNLLQNSAKFTDAGGLVTVTAGIVGDRVAIGVRDTGIGITVDMLARMFEPFTQADESLHRTRGGLGLGLALVKGLVEMHGGSVEARSDGIGRGTEVVVRLPLAPPAAEAPPAATTAAGPSRPRRILVIEDNLDAAETLRDMLELWGHVVAVAHAGRQGIERASSFEPEIVLCDIGLPEMDGYEVARAMRADARVGSPVLVALTGYALPEDQRRAAEAGFELHVAKPVSVAQMEDMLARAGDMGDRRRATRTHPRSTA